MFLESSSSPVSTKRPAPENPMRGEFYIGAAMAS